MRAESAPRFIANNKNLLPISPVRREITVTDERPQEECGLISFYAPNGMTSREASKIFKSAEGVQHRGQQGGGVTAHAMNGEKYSHKGFGLLPEALPESIQQKVADMGDLRSVTIQARYGTHGGYEPDNLQPLETKAKDGTAIEVAHNGNFANTQTLTEQSGKTYDYDVSDSRVWADALPKSNGDTWDDRIVNAVHAAEGAASLIINVGDETQYAARDVKGIRPLVLGSIDGELGPIHVIASETKALNLIDVPADRDVRPGEIVRFDKDGLTVLEKGDKTKERMCSMEHAYMSSADSRVNVTSNGASPETWPKHSSNRYEIGLQMAREEKSRQIAAKKKAERLGEPYEEFKPDVVVGIPSSGLPFGKGYAEGLEIPYRELITKNPEENRRLFQTDDEMDKIKDRVLKKLVVETPEGWDWEGKKVVLVDDSLVRGSVSHALSTVLSEDLGAEVHWRFGYPKIANPCHLGVSIRTHDELLAHRTNGDVEKMAKEIGAKSVDFISNVGFVKSVQGEHFQPTANPKDVFDANRMCGGCITGEYPYAKDEAAYVRPTTSAS